MSKQQYDGIHILRIVACLMVIVIHTGLSAFDRFSGRWTSVVAYDSFSHACNSLFFMITGFLLLNTDDGIVKFYKKRFIRIVLPLLFYSSIYLYSKGTPPNQYLLKIWSGPVEYHLWYVYTLFGVYLFLPFLQLIYKNTTNFEKFLYLGLWFVINVMFYSLKSYFHFNTGFVDNTNFPMFVGYAGYVFLGAALRNITCRQPRLYSAIFIISSAMSFISSYFYSHSTGKPEVIFMTPFSFFVFTAAVSIFYSLKDRKITYARQFIYSL